MIFYFFVWWLINRQLHQKIRAVYIKSDVLIFETPNHQFDIIPINVIHKIKTYDLFFIQLTTFKYKFDGRSYFLFTIHRKYPLSIKEIIKGYLQDKKKKQVNHKPDSVVAV